MTEPGLTPSHTAELFRMEAVRSGNRVVQLRAIAAESGYAVECHVDAVDGRTVEARPPHAHAFTTQAEAKAFVDEAAAALQYLGCHIRSQSV